MHADAGGHFELCGIHRRGQAGEPHSGMNQDGVLWVHDAMPGGISDVCAGNKNQRMRDMRADALQKYIQSLDGSRLAVVEPKSMIGVNDDGNSRQ